MIKMNHVCAGYATMALGQQVKNPVQEKLTAAAHAIKSRICQSTFLHIVEQAKPD